MDKETSMTAAAEAVLFAMGEPVSLQVLARALGTDISTARDVLDNLHESYETQERGIRLVELEGSYQLCTKPEYYDNLITVAAMPEKPVLTDTVLETLSIVAFRQPVTKAEISRIRGVSSDHAVSRLVEYGLIQEAGRLNAPGRPMLFVTTREFLRRFGMEERPHKAYLNDCFRGLRNLSASRGELYNEDLVTGDARLCGTTAAL